MNAYIQLDGNISELFKVRSGVKQGCVQAFILLPSFNMPLMRTRMEFTLRTRFDAPLFNLERLKSKRLTNCFSDGTAKAAHIKIELERQAETCDPFGLTIRDKKKR